MFLSICNGKFFISDAFVCANHLLSHHVLFAKRLGSFALILGGWTPS